MRTPFSERQGLVPPRTTLQLDDIDQPLRNRLYNCLTVGPPSFGSDGITASDRQMSAFGKAVCGDFLRRPIVWTSVSELKGATRELFQFGEWYRVYDLLEFVAGILPHQTRDAFIRTCNRVLKEEHSAYRFLDGVIVPVNAPSDVAAIEAGLQHTLKAARDHIAKALQQLATRPDPNYAKVAAEAIQAVEAVARDLIDDDSASLGEALKTLRRGKTHHAALLDVFLKLHGWASDEGGVRHAFKGDQTDQALAKYVLISCAAFIGYLTEVKAMGV